LSRWIWTTTLLGLFKLKALLVLKKVWKAVTEDTVDADVNETALSLLLLNVKSHHYPFITSATTAKEAWNALLGAYKAQSLARKQLLRKKLSNLKKAPKEPISKYYSRACQIRDDMIAAGVSDKEIDLVGALLSGLPNEYALLVEVLEMHATDMKPDDVYTRLLRHEQKLNESSSPDTDGAALYMAQGESSSAKASSSGQHQAGLSSSGAAKKTCHYCHKPGHIKKNCFKFKADQRKKNGHNGNAASAHPAVTDEGFKSSTAEFAFVTASASAMLIDCCEEEWVIDSGATRHMTCNKSKLQDLQLFDQPAPVTVGDNHVINALGIGNASFYVNGGNRVAQLQVKNVLYVPDLALNLISVRKMTEHGAVVHFSKERCTIEVGGFSFDAAEHGSLYILQEYARPNNCAMVAAKFCTQSVKLWHQRLGHLGYANLFKLVRRGMVKGISLTDKDMRSPETTCEPCILGKHHRKPFPV